MPLTCQLALSAVSDVRATWFNAQSFCNQHIKRRHATRLLTLMSHLWDLNLSTVLFPLDETLKQAKNGVVIFKSCVFVTPQCAALQGISGQAALAHMEALQEVAPKDVSLDHLHAKVCVEMACSLLATSTYQSQSGR